MIDVGKKNILWINYLKGIGIIGVLFVHCTQYYGLIPSVVNTFIHPFYVNAFFFVSGYLLFRKQLSDKLKKLNLTEYWHGQNTLGFYFMSGALPIIISGVVHKIFPSINYGGLSIVFLFSLGIGFVAVYIMNSFFPWLFDLRLLMKSLKQNQL